MFYQFLRSVQIGNVHSLVEMARIMNISQDMALQMVMELTQKGYLQTIGGDCTTPEPNCSDCLAGSACQANNRGWHLTEKGKAAVTRIPVDVKTAQ